MEVNLPQVDVQQQLNGLQQSVNKLDTAIARIDTALIAISNILNTAIINLIVLYNH